MAIHSALQFNFLHKLLGTSRTAQILNLVVIFMVVCFVGYFLFTYVVRWILEALDYRHLQKRQLVFLELTPPTITTKTLLATTQLYVGVHGLLMPGSFKDRWLRHKNLLPLEVASTRSGGIRFIAPIEADLADVFHRHLVSFMPEMRIREVEDYLPLDVSERPWRLLEFEQANHFGYKMATADKLNQHDPMDYILGAMTKTGTDELTAFQIIISPADRRVASRVHHRLLHGQEPMVRRRWWKYPFILLGKLIKLAFGVLRAFMETIGDEVSGVRSPRYAKPYNHYEPPTITPYTKHVIDDSYDKLDQPLFTADIRALVIGPQAKERARGLINALHQYHVPGYQGLLVKRSIFKSLARKRQLTAFTKRLPSVFTASSSVLAASEVASLYHFPDGETSAIENVVTSLNKSLPATVSMKRHADAADYDVMLGMNHYHGSDTVIGLTAKEREKHVYLIGGTGNGKTTMLEFAIIQDMINGKGVAFIDPHGDAAQKLLRYIPQHRIKDVIYLNPIDVKFPIAINLLELPEGLDEDELLIEKERVTESVISVFRKVFADDEANAHRIEAMFRNAIHTAFTVPNATLFTVLKLFRNSEFREEVVSKLEDEELIDFWQEEFGKAGNMQRVSMSKGATLRIDRFQRSAPAKRMLDQPKSTISFEDIMDSGKILICNFSQDMGEDTSTLFGTTVLAKLKIAAERRSRQLEAQRRPFYVYVDEFQNFATTPFVKMLSASRKYKLFLTLAEQSTAQQEEKRLTEAILANVSTIVCFGLGSPADEHLLLQRFQPQLVKGELTNQSAYNFYIRIKAEEPMEPVSGETIVAEPDKGTDERAEEVIAASRKNYAREFVKPKPVPKPAKPKTASKSASKRRYAKRRKVINKPAIDPKNKKKK